MNDKKKLLIFVDWFYPGYKAGGPIQSCKNIVDTLSDEFDTYIFTSDSDIGDSTSYSGVKINEWTQYNGVAKIFYAAPSYQTVKYIDALIEEIKPDIIYLNSMFSVGFTLKPLLAKRKHQNSKVVLAPRGMLHAGATQQKKTKKWLFLNALKYSGALKNILFHATDEQEYKDIKKYFNNDVCTVKNIPNIHSGGIKYIEKKENEARFVFISRIHLKKNLLFFLELLKKTSGHRIVFDIYGYIDDEAYWQKCQKAIGQLPPDIVVTYKNALPNIKVFETIQQYHVFVLPTLGENFGHSIFEAMSAGRPVLLSDQTPWQNLAVQKVGWDIPLSNEIVFLKTINDIAGYNQPQFDEYVNGASAYAKKSIDLPNLKTQYKQLFS